MASSKWPPAKEIEDFTKIAVDATLSMSVAMIFVDERWRLGGCVDEKWGNV